MTNNKTLTLNNLNTIFNKFSNKFVTRSFCLDLISDIYHVAFVADYKYESVRSLSDLLNLVTDTICNYLGIDNEIDWRKITSENHSIKKYTLMVIAQSINNLCFNALHNNANSTRYLIATIKQIIGVELTSVFETYIPFAA